MRIAYLALIELDVPNACLIHSKEIAEQMVELGHEVEMFLPLPLRKQVWRGMKHHWVRFWGFDALRRHIFLIGACFKILRSHKENAFDCLYLREMEAASLLCQLCKHLKLPLFVEVNGWLLDDLRLINASDAALKKAESNQGVLLQSTCGVIASTLGNAENVKKHYQVEHVMTQELGVNASLFAGMESSQARKHLKLRNDEQLILFAGSFHPHHDLKTLIHAFARLQKGLSNVRLLLVGDGAQYQDVQAWVNDLGLQDKVLFSGSQPYEDMPYWFAAADLLVSPLIAQKIKQQNGALATKVWEAMAAATPVLVTDMEGTQSYQLLSQLAWVCEPENSEDMANVMQKALCGSSHRVEHARAYVLEERSWRKAASDTLDFMRDCMRHC